MSNALELPKYGNYIDGANVPPLPTSNYPPRPAFREILGADKSAAEWEMY